MNRTIADYELMLFTAANLALNKPANQTSTYSTWVAGRAVDGLNDTESCTDYYMHPWWTVDLGAAYDIGHVTVTNIIASDAG